MEKKKHISDIEAILDHLNTHGINDKDARPRVKRPEKSKINRTPRNLYRYRLDLHGMTSEEASRSLKITIDSCKQRGIQELLIIHGIGYHSDVNAGPVLKGLVRTMLDCELHHKIRGYKPAPLKDGGDGATIVHLW